MVGMVRYFPTNVTNPPYDLTFVGLNRLNIIFSQGLAIIYIIIYISCAMIVYEWSEEKRLINLERHGLDFWDAWRVHEAPGKITLKSSYSDEERWIDMAEVEGAVLLLVYTMRGGNVRCISYRRAKRRKEGRLYYEHRED